MAVLEFGEKKFIKNFLRADQPPSLRMRLKEDDFSSDSFWLLMYFIEFSLKMCSYQSK